MSGSLLNVQREQKMARKIIILGGPGAGKTALAINTFLLRFRDCAGRILWAFNDDGSPKGSDAFRRLSTQLNIIFRPIMGGCFGCNDVREQLAALCREADEELHCDFLFVETYGFLGQDVVRLMRDMGHQPHVVTLVNARNFTPERDLALQMNGVAVVHDQLRAATLGVLITKYPPDVEVLTDSRLDKVMAAIGIHAPDREVALLPPGQGIPETFFARMSSVPPPSSFRVVAPPRKRLLLHSPSHHAHAAHARTFALREDVGLADLQTWCAARTDVFRIKGVIGGTGIDYDGAAWSETAPGFVDREITVYSRTALAPKDLAMLASETSLGASQAATLEQRVKLIEWYLEQAPTEVLFLTASGDARRVITHPETINVANLLWQEDDRTPAHVIARVLRARVSYFLLVAETTLCPGTAEWDEPSQGESLRALAIGLGWYASQRADVIGDDLFARIARLPHLAEMLERGLLLMQANSLHTDQAKALDYVKELDRALLWIGRESVARGLTHVIELVRNEKPSRPALLSAWQALL